MKARKNNADKSEKDLENRRKYLDKMIQGCRDSLEVLDYVKTQDFNNLFMTDEAIQMVSGKLQEFLEERESIYSGEQPGE